MLIRHFTSLRVYFPYVLLLVLRMQSPETPVCKPVSLPVISWIMYSLCPSMNFLTCSEYLSARLEVYLGSVVDSPIVSLRTVPVV